MSHSDEITGLTELRKGFQYLIITYTIALIGIVVIASLEYSLALLAPSLGSFNISASMAGLLIGAVILIIIILPLIIYAIFIKIRAGFRHLMQVDNQFKTSYTGTTLIIVGTVLMIVGLVAIVAAILMTAEPPYGPGGVIASLAVFIIGAIIGAVGNILTLIVGAFSLHNRYKESQYRTAGVLYIIAMVVAVLISFSGDVGTIVVSIINLIATILMYMALGTTISKLTTR